MLYPIAAAVLAAALAAACWRCIILRRALVHERAASRLRDHTWACDAAGWEAREHRRRIAARADAAVMAEANAVVAWAAIRLDLPRGGTDG